jgi:hypothetical protein
VDKGGKLTEIFRSSVRFDYLVKDAAAKGWAFEQQALTRQFVKELAAELERGEYEPFTGEQKVYERFERLVGATYPSERLGLAMELGDVTGQMVRTHAGRWKVLAGWQPNDLAVQRYVGPESKIGRHRDYARDRLLVAVYTVTGCAQLELFADRYEGGAFATCETGPGSLLLLRGPGLVVGIDGRITHAVGPPLGSHRISVAYRQSDKAAS